MTDPKVILFVCIENSARSQMAEGFFRKLAPSGYRCDSAGTRPAGSINPLAIQVMNEVGIDISRQRTKVISLEVARDSFMVVNMGCMDSSSCPALLLSDTINWDIEDPKGKAAESVRRIRDEIEVRVRELVASL